MKKIKSVLLSAAVLAAAVSMSACTKTKKTTSDGIEYTYIKEGKDSPKDGEYVLYNLIAMTSSDSTFISTIDDMAPQVFQYKDSANTNLGVEEIILGLRKGDSITFAAPAAKIFGEFNVPFFLKAEEDVKIRLGVIDVLDEDGVQAYFTALQDAQMKKQSEKAAKQLETDVKLIEEYISKNNLNATKTESGLFYVIEREGSGDQIEAGQTAEVDYAGYLLDGTIFDTSNKEKAQAGGVYNEQRDQMNGYEPLEVQVGVGRVIPGWDEGLSLLKNGSKAKFLIPSTLAYGDRQSGAVIKPNSVLIFDVEVTNVK
ncbi:FKBP-type peptidyl-prolyl cis-trans isomerase [Belliella kenyensis]|uniref:Peptidyl-prolyl cis-trans isomerase n=1 Tax=Belliella kenyensis TaxID=1472724 RepID=A0ABV8EI71_9BACT|nr:FKBP-type peptidyl-prolyl cis-trans isomerase [Belliella kenyensis]MCH7403698.1 FKBP-type peptidyl-prolyl cis-trans isomerase [Belliella kenyensis]MDN3603465.1 FKBP-type peptidyl-prolyl cis-trans isomerase [Belliella kenyensis]